MECAKFCGSRAIVGLVGLVPPCHCALHGYEFFSRGYFMDPKFFLVGISTVQNIFLWVFLGSQIFSCGYFVGPRFFLVGILWSKIV